jgi:hypothetical protein
VALGVMPQNHAGRVCSSGEMTSFRRVDLDDGRIVQIGVCTSCDQVIARLYVVTGPGTGEWVVLRERGGGIAMADSLDSAYIARLRRLAVNEPDGTLIWLDQLAGRLAATGEQRTDPEPPQIDQLASLARTALDDPSAVPDPDGSRLENEQARGTLPGDDAYVRYAIAKLDEIIGILNPPEVTRASAHRTVLVLARHLVDLNDELDPLGGVRSEEVGYAHGRIEAAIEHLDEAITALREDTDEPV